MKGGQHMNNSTTILKKIKRRQQKATRFNPFSFILEVTELTGSQQETAKLLADKAQQDVLRSSIVRYCPTSPNLVLDLSEFTTH